MDIIDGMKELAHLARQIDHIELNKQILTLQQQVMELLEEKRDLEERLLEASRNNDVRELVTSPNDGMVALPQPPAGPINEKIVESVAAELPAQPWPAGIHREIATRLSISRTQAWQAIDTLIQRGRFLPQMEGRVYEPDDAADPGLERL